MQRSSDTDSFVVQTNKHVRFSDSTKPAASESSAMADSQHLSEVIESLAASTRELQSHIMAQHLAAMPSATQSGFGPLSIQGSAAFAYAPPQPQVAALQLPGLGAGAPAPQAQSQELPMSLFAAMHAQYAQVAFQQGLEMGRSMGPKEKPCFFCEQRKERNRIAAANARRKAKEVSSRPQGTAKGPFDLTDEDTDEEEQ